MDNVWFALNGLFSRGNTPHPTNSRASLGCGNCGIYRGERSIVGTSRKRRPENKSILWETELGINDVLTWHCEVRCCGYRMTTKLTSYDLPKLQTPVPKVHCIGLKERRKEGSECIFKKWWILFTLQPRIRAPYLIFSGWHEFKATTHCNGNNGP